MRISSKPRHRHCMHLFLCLAAMASAATSPAQQDGDLSTWECLPEETAVAIRVPHGSRFADALVENTKLGTVLFSEQRIETFRQFISEREAEDGQDFAAVLGRYGLTPEDLAQFVAGETGYAILASHLQEDRPLVAGIAWLQPGADLAERAYESIGKLVEDREDDEHPVRRVDFELVGQPVMQLMVPAIRLEYGEFELPDNYDTLSEAEQSQVWDRAYKKYSESAVETVNYHTVLVATLGERLLIAQTLNEATEEQREMSAERLETVLARLIAAHDGEPGRFTSRIMATPGVRSVLDPQGVVALEAFGDVPRLLELLRRQPGFQADTNSEKVMSMLGADQVGPFAMRVTLDGTQLHARLFVAAGEPRSGLLQLLNQEPLSVEPPAWVPATAISYSQLSFDLGAAYRTVKGEVSRAFPEQSEQVFQMAETQVRNLAQADLEDILDSLGRRHVAVSFEPEIMKRNAGEVDVEVPQDRMAFVWQLADEAAWSSVLKAIGTFAAFAPGLESTDEQGFHGWRFANQGVEGGLVMGKGYLVVGMGRGVLEMTLSSLDRPPGGDAALRESDLFRRASQLLEPRPAIGYDVTDADRFMRAARKMLESLLDQMEQMQQLSGEFADEEAEPDTAWIELGRALLPNEEEVENLFGVVVSELNVNGDGITYRSVNELPLPD